MTEVVQNVVNVELTCVDTVGSAHCDCPQGFYSADPATVGHSDEGQSPPGAGVAAPLPRTEGSWDKQCHQINECNYGACEADNSICFDEVPQEIGGLGYTCGCAPGYEPIEVCVDVDGNLVENSNLTAVENDTNTN